MNGFNESGIELDFADENYFRLCSCPAYQYLSGNYFKEVDACWLDKKLDVYWMVELKDFSLASHLVEETINKISWDLVKKCVDSLCLLLSSKHGYPYAKESLDSCLPLPLTKTTQFKFITIIHCEQSQRADIQLINEKFKSRFKPYAEIFGIEHYGVAEHQSATKFLSFVK